MAATALIQFVQGVTTSNGQALIGVLDTVAHVRNVDNTEVGSWQIDLVWADPRSGVAALEEYAYGDGAVPEASFTPTGPGSLRWVLKVWSATGRVGDPTSVDVRVFSVREVNGFIVPPAQLWPPPLPDPRTGEATAKPHEMNYGGQGNGWAGTGSGDGLLNNLVRQMDDSLTYVVPYTETIYVSSETSSLPEHGTVDRPYRTVQAALNAVAAALVGTGPTRYKIVLGPGTHAGSTLSFAPVEGTRVPYLCIEGEQHESTVLGATTFTFTPPESWASVVTLRLEYFYSACSFVVTEAVAGPCLASFVFRFNNVTMGNLDFTVLDTPTVSVYAQGGLVGPNSWFQRATTLANISAAGDGSSVCLDGVLCSGNVQAGVALYMKDTLLQLPSASVTADQIRLRNTGWLGAAPSITATHLSVDLATFYYVLSSPPTLVLEEALSPLDGVLAHEFPLVTSSAAGDVVLASFDTDGWMDDSQVRVKFAVDVACPGGSTDTYFEHVVLLRKTAGTTTIRNAGDVVLTDVVGNPSLATVHSVHGEMSGNVYQLVGTAVGSGASVGLQWQVSATFAYGVLL